MRKGASSRPGPWRTESYQKEIFDCLADPRVRLIVFRKSTQVGWSAILNAIAGYFIDADPSPILFVQAGKLSAEDYSKTRIAPLIADCRALAEKIAPATKRQGNTLLLKEFPGGFLRFAFATSAKTLRSYPIRILILDEVDGYVDDCEGEGNPIDIATRRTDTFDDAKILIGSTPAKPKGLSQVEDYFDRSDQRYFWVPCPKCGFPQPLVWRDLGEFVPPHEVEHFKGIFGTGAYRLRWEKDDKGAPVPGTVRYHCAHCEYGIDERYKQRMLDAGEWRPRFPGRRDMAGYAVAGFSINALYSPWTSTVWSLMAQEWHEAQDDPEKLKAFVNLRLGEVWNDEERGFKLDDVLAARTESYPLIKPVSAGGIPHWNNQYVPSRCCLIIGTADIQRGGGGRIEAQITGFGPGEESWLIAHEAFMGDASVVDSHGVWGEVDRFFLREWPHESGALLRPEICLVDSGDQTAAVYEFVLPRQIAARRVYACKGIDRLSIPGLAKQGAAKKQFVKLWMIAADAGKDRVYARLKIPPHPKGEPRPGYHHLPDWTTQEYMKQLAGERKTAERDKKTHRYRQRYTQVYVRTEALDLTVYAHGGLFIMQNFIDPARYRNLEKLHAEVIESGKNAPNTVAGKVLPPRRHRVISEGIRV